MLGLAGISPPPFPRPHEICVARSLSAGKAITPQTSVRRAKSPVFGWGDSLPMHFALGTGTQCSTLFTCTSPWEIYDYEVQQKILSPLLEEFFYRRGYDRRATTAISVDEVLSAVMAQLEGSAIAASHAAVK